MKSLIAGALLSLEIDCNQQSGLDKPQKDSAWKYQICQTQFSAYTDVKLEPIALTKKNLKGSSLHESIVSSDPLFGRLVVTRVSKKNGGGLESMAIKYRIFAKKKVWVAARSLYAGSNLRPGDAEKVLMEVGGYIGLKSFIDLDPQGQIMQRRVLRGQILFSEMIAEKPLIDRDKELRVIVSVKNIKLELKGVAIERAYTKDKEIKVRLCKTNKVITGRILNNETVLVDN